MAYGQIAYEADNYRDKQYPRCDKPTYCRNALFLFLVIFQHRTSFQGKRLFNLVSVELLQDMGAFRTLLEVFFYDSAAFVSADIVPVQREKVLYQTAGIFTRHFVQSFPKVLILPDGM